MDINLLVVGIGNSRLAVGAFVAGELRAVSRVPLTDSAACSAAIEKAWAELKDLSGAAVAAASVNPPVTDKIDRLIGQVTNYTPQWVGRDLELPIDVQTDEPDKTGIDRVLAVAAAYEQIGKALVVVDAGTAITVNFCSDQGVFVGGAIAPGVSTMLDSLHNKTAMLPRIEFDVPTDNYGKTTEQAIRLGVYNAARGLVKELTEAFATEQGQWPELICTGGDAEKLFAGWELVHAVSPDLVLYGIAMAYADHHIKNNT